MKNIVLKIFLIAACSFVIYSCKKSDISTPVNTEQQSKDSTAEILNYSIDGMTPAITITPLSVIIHFADTVYNPQNLTASFTLSSGATATINGTTQISGETKNNYNSYLNYSVKNASGITKHWIVTATNNNYSSDWGLGNFLKQSVSNDRSYNWYYTQAGTGDYQYINCGPACVTMAMKWADSTFNLLPVDARNYFPQNTDYWGYNTMQQYMGDKGFMSKYVPLGSTPDEGKNTIKQQLDSGNIVVLLLSTLGIRSYVGGATDPRVDKFYPDVFNHFIVAYGYKEVDGEFYFQVNDPWNWGWVHKDGSPECKNRYYRYTDVYFGCALLDGGALIVYKKK